MNTSKESGSHVVMLALVVLFLAVAGFAGYQVYQRQMTPAETVSGSSVPAKITNTATLNQAGSALDSASAQVNSNLDDSALNSDLNAML